MHTTRSQVRATSKQRTTRSGDLPSCLFMNTGLPFITSPASIHHAPTDACTLGTQQPSYRSTRQEVAQTSWIEKQRLGHQPSVCLRLDISYLSKSFSSTVTHFPHTAAVNQDAHQVNQTWRAIHSTLPYSPTPHSIFPRLSHTITKINSSARNSLSHTSPISDFMPLTLICHRDTSVIVSY